MPLTKQYQTLAKNNPKNNSRNKQFKDESNIINNDPQITKDIYKALRKKDLSRLMAIQIFYQFEFYKGLIEIEEIKNQTIDNYLLSEEDNISSYRSKINEELIDNLLTIINQQVEPINQDIIKFLKHQNSFEQIPDLALDIIRFSAFELKFFHHYAQKAIINSYINIVASFFSEKIVKFSNGIIENLASHYRDNKKTEDLLENNKID
jgi:transcription termination factor NusB